MKICIVGPVATENISHLLGENDVSGIPVGYRGAPVIGILIEGMLKRGHEVVAISTDSSLESDGRPFKFNCGNFQYILVPQRKRAFRKQDGRWGRATDQFSAERKALTEEISAANPDVVHAHWSYEFALAAVEQKKPHVITCHDSPLNILLAARTAYCAVRYLMARKVFKRGRYFSTVSDYMLRELPFSIRPRVRVIPNPVSPKAIELGSKRFLGNSRKIAMVNNGWSRHKNPQAGIRAFKIFRKNNPAASLHLFGADYGPEEKAEIWSRKHGLSDGVVFEGRFEHPVLLERIKEMDVLLHPSLEESFGMVVAEAMALGLPVVAGRSSGAVPWVMGLEENSPGLAGVLTDVKSPQAIAFALLNVFSNNIYSEMSRLGRDRVERLFSLDGVLNQYERLYECAQAGQ